MLTSLVLIVLLAVLGVTIVRIGQLLWLHLFLGLVLLGPVALKLASTGYRFVRYYTFDPAYRREGPPAPGLRALGPLVVASTLAVFGTGVVLLILGPSSRQPLVLLHKVTFFAWIALTGLHVVGHLPEIGRYVRTARTSRREIMARRTCHQSEGHTERAPRTERRRRPGPPARNGLPGRGGRALSLSVALIGGLVLAGALVPQFHVWTH